MSYPRFIALAAALACALPATADAAPSVKVNVPLDTGSMVNFEHYQCFTQNAPDDASGRWGGFITVRATSAGKPLKATELSDGRIAWTVPGAQHRLVWNGSRVRNRAEAPVVFTGVCPIGTRR